MILTPHLLVGAALASRVPSIPLVLILAFLSHYLFDIFPHQEYSIENIKEKRWRKTRLEFLKIGVDFSLGILLILLLSQKTPIIFAGAFFAILADGFAFLGFIFSNKFLQHNDDLHQKLHILGNKKIPFFGGIVSQIIISLSAISLL